MNTIQFDIQPYVGAGPIELGMTREQAVAILGPNFRTLRGKATDENFPTIRYVGLDVMIFFKPPGVVEALEFFEDSNLLLNGTNLFRLPLPELKSLLIANDQDLEVSSPEELTSYKLGIAVYAPEAEDDPKLPAGAIMIFERGYYESE